MVRSRARLAIAEAMRGQGRIDSVAFYGGPELIRLGVELYIFHLGLCQSGEEFPFRRSAQHAEIGVGHINARVGGGVDCAGGGVGGDSVDSGGGEFRGQIVPLAGVLGAEHVDGRQAGDGGVGPITEGG